jgi:hypothetical protein
MKPFNWRAALESRPIEDQDLEDTAKPAPDAGQIDGDTTTLGGMAKPGENPVPDKQDIAVEDEKINERPVDLDDVILIDQNRRAYQPLVSDTASAMAVDEQNIAQEGFFSKTIEKVGDFFMHREKDLKDGYTSLKENLAAIETMRNKIIRRGGEVDVNGDSISLSRYAKWLSIDGKLLDDPQRLIREVERLYEFVQWCTSSYNGAVNRMYDFIARDVYKLGESDLDKALANSKLIITRNEPKDAKKWLTGKETTTWKGKQFTDLVMPQLPGQWGLVGMAQEEDAPVPGIVLRILQKKDAAKVSNGEFRPLPKDVMRKILDLCEKIENQFASNKVDGALYERYWDAMDEFAYRYRSYKSLPKSEQTKVEDIYLAGKMVITYDCGTDTLAHANHFVKVLLLYIEKSLRRVK